ncbi:hypothetical protein ACP4OV_013646 [Aristida adscensionis]
MNDELEMVGFEKDRLFLERLLLEGDKRRSIMSIVGQSGIGKYTLVEMVVNSYVVTRQFKARTTYVLPPCASVCYALYEIYKRLCPFDNTSATKEEIHDTLTEHLKDKCYLIVLGGADKLFNWTSVLDALPNNDLGSRIVIINDHEASLDGLSIHELRVHHLDEENSKLLFRRHALGSRNQHPNKSLGKELELSESEYKEAQMDEASKYSSLSEYEKQMDEACKDMFEITNGLPLAILILGRLLRRKEFPEQWRDVLNHLKSMKPSSRLEGTLALSFDDLPHHLKSCFLYFAMMPPNMGYLAQYLVRIWAAEGFLKPKKGQSMEDVGHNYLKELISRGMVAITGKVPMAFQESNVREYGVFIHQQLHAMARLETQEGSFIYDNTDADPSTSMAVRHMYIQKLSDATYTHMEDTSFPKSKLLRAMSLHGLQVRKLPHVIGSLIHLRYLCIQESSLVELPSTIVNLINLQTLDIKETKVQKVTPAFWMIPTLRHVLAKQLHLPKSSALADAFKQLESLLELHLTGDDIPFNLFTNFSLRRLQVLELNGRMAMLPNEETEQRWSLPNLISLDLMDSRVNQGFINMIGKLPCLAELKLWTRVYRGGELVFSQESGFSRLTDLELYIIKGFSVLKIRSESLPKVERVVVANCTNMKLKIEGEQVLKGIKEFKVIDMPEDWGVEEAGALSEKFVRV